MKTRITFNYLFLFLIPLVVFAQNPEWNERKKAKLKETCETEMTMTLIVYQDGEIKFTFGDPSGKFKIFSIRKSLVSLLYGIYNDGTIDLDATLSDLQVDDLDGLTSLEKQAKILDLLKAKSGIYHNAAFETPGMMNRRPERGSHAPGTFWFYNNWDFNALITIFEQETGLSVFEAFERRIADPLGMKDFDIKDQEYVLEEDRSIHKATLWRLSGRDLLSLGIMVLEKGKVGDKQVVPPEWIIRSAEKYSDLGMFGAYGLCWWVAKDGQHYPFVNFPDGTFSARGTGMQDLIIVPAYNMVIVHQTDVKGPDDQMMKVTDFGRMLKVVMDQ